MAEKEDRKDVESTAKKLPYPKAVFCILANEFCERFSYYGMKAVLTIYLKNVLKFSEDNATVIYHAFAMLCYFTPLLGAMIADSFLGKFRTIFYLSVVYAAGNVVLSLAATPPIHLPATAFSLIGLVLIAFGTGGIKPCVSSFGGDQFKVPEQAKELATFFSIFYFTINAGSLISTLITPVFRTDVKCFGNDTCYTLAFSVPAALMITSLVIFLIGRPFYTINPPQGNIFASVMKTIFHALSRKMKSKEKKEHWLDYANDKYPRRRIEEIKILLRVLFLYLPLPFFWALFDQQGSRWTLQATRMDGNIGFFFIKPDQMQVANPLLILLFIPLFEKFVYPILAKLGLLKKPLQRLTTGGVFAGIAFVVSGLIELQLQKTYPVELSAGQSHFHLINMAPLDLNFELTPFNSSTPAVSDKIMMNSNHIIETINNGNYNLKFNSPDANVTGDCDVTLYSEKASSLLVAWNDTSNQIVCVTASAKQGLSLDNEDAFDTLEKEGEGNPYVRILQYGVWEDPGDSAADEHNKIVARNKWNKITLLDKKKQKTREEFEYNETSKNFESTPMRAIQFKEYEIFVGTEGKEHPDNGEVFHTLPALDSFNLKLGGSYILTLVKNDNATGNFTHQLNEYIKPNSMHMLWLLPQYIIMTAGEVMFSVTIMDFSYSQAPSSMKSVMQSAWLMTVAFGNLIDVIVAAAQIFDKQWKEFFFFAGLMFADMIIFSYLAYRYQPADPNVLLANLDEDEDKDKDEKDGKVNPALEDDKER